MLGFLYALSFLFNFTYGVLLPIIPHLNEDVAGWAFTAFLLCKLLWYVPAGHVNDRVGSGPALTLALVIQVLALTTIALLPHYPWLGRCLEGVALAQGTLSTFGFIRILAPEQAAFRASVAKLLGIGGLGMIVGPFIGYSLLPLGPAQAILALAGLNALFLGGQVFLARAVPARDAPHSEPTETEHFGHALWFVAGLTAAKALAVGWEPNLAWWAQSFLGFSPAVAGASFLVLGVAFILGSLRPQPIATFFSFVAYHFVEYAIAPKGDPHFWWFGLAILGYWYGMYVTIAVGRLGWDKPEKIGRHNSVWMLVTDLPMAFVPAILWHWREHESFLARYALAGALLVIAGVSLWRGLRGFRAPRQSSRA
jgi:MFS family permease